MTEKKKYYTYDGPVMHFDKCVNNKWSASTYAVSPSKAKSNLAYRYKKEHNLVASSKIALPGKIKLAS